jgi:hypothetical protein
MKGIRPLLAALEAQWMKAWPGALEAWSRFTKLADPRWCHTEEDEEREHLSGSFAMIRLTDHAVVISLRQVHQKRLERFAREILAHEVGHHVLAPADLRDNARLHARVRASLPSRETFSGMVANLYTDLLINDRLQRSAGLDIASVYRALDGGSGDRVWSLYLRIYEVLWQLPSGTLAQGRIDKALDFDAYLGARVIRTYGQNWLAGAGRFAALLLPYLLAMPEDMALKLRLPPWFDADQAGAGGDAPDGLAEVEGEEETGAVHPAADGELTGVDPAKEGDGRDGGRPDAGGKAAVGGRKNQYREPDQYRELMKSLGVTTPDDELTVRYYRERALPHLIPFPSREAAQASDPLPEGLDTWEPGDPLPDIDWAETSSRSPHVIPGVTTVRREFGTTVGTTPDRVPVDLYIGIDCSGSMRNPSQALSYPVLAGTVVALSALRAGARVMACLSGEPGAYTQTDGFVRSEGEILKTLTGYLGQGYSFGIRRLEETFLRTAQRDRPVHILVVSDHDIFTMLNEVPDGWAIARDALERAGGGGTLVLELSFSGLEKKLDRLRTFGWNVHPVKNQDELLAFARAFSRSHYGGVRAAGRGTR